MDVKVWAAPLDFGSDFEICCSWQIGMDPSLHADLGRAGVPGLGGAVADLLEGEGVGVGVGAPLGEGAEPAAGVADVGEVDVAGDHVGDLVTDHVPAQGVGDAGQRLQVGPVGVEQGDRLSVGKRGRVAFGLTESSGHLAGSEYRRGREHSGRREHRRGREHSGRREHRRGREHSGGARCLARGGFLAYGGHRRRARGWGPGGVTGMGYHGPFSQFFPVAVDLSEVIPTVIGTAGGVDGDVQVGPADLRPLAEAAVGLLPRQAARRGTVGGQAGRRVGQRGHVRGQPRVQPWLADVRRVDGQPLA
jgi:hypothetical protein